MLVMTASFLARHSHAPEASVSRHVPDLAADRDLARRLDERDGAAFDTLASQHLRGLYRFASRRLDGDPELTKEIVQRTLVKVFANLSTYRGDGTFFAWLCTCCRNEIRMYWRSRSTGPRMVGLDDDGVPADALATPGFQAPDHALQRSETAEHVHLALDLLPDHYARALEWKYTEGLPVREIASRLELSEKATESLLTRARIAFRSRYEEVCTALDREPRKDTFS